MVFGLSLDAFRIEKGVEYRQVSLPPSTAYVAHIEARKPFPGTNMHLFSATVWCNVKCNICHFVCLFVCLKYTPTCICQAILEKVESS